MFLIIGQFGGDFDWLHGTLNSLRGDAGRKSESGAKKTIAPDDAGEESEFSKNHGDQSQDSDFIVEMRPSC